jgi:NTE family protein
VPRPPVPSIRRSRGRPESRLPFRDAPGGRRDKENLVVLAFSGGGTRAAAFSYGVLEFLRDTEIVGPKGNKGPLARQVDVITGVSGGSFTALAYGLYGDKLFVDYEQRFLKRDVQGEIISRTFSPANWGKLSGTAWGRSELASELYDEILFNNATFGDLNRGEARLSSLPPPTSRPARASSSTSASSTSSARISTPSTCRAPRRRRRPCPSYSRR